MSEEALLFGKTRSLVGIITDPPEAKRSQNLPAILLLNAGILHRVGPHRLYVKMARHLAAMGFVVFRFDFSGIGDSKARDDTLPFEKRAVSETREAMNCLSSTRSIERFFLLGICSGAVVSFQAACHDPRVVGAVLINAEAYQYNTSEELHSYIAHRKVASYYRKTALFKAASWLNAVKGKADYRRIIRTLCFQLRGLFIRQRKVSSEADKIAANLRLLSERGVRLLLVYSEGDPDLDYLHVVLGDEMHELSSCGQLRIEVIPQADHTFTLLQNQQHLLTVVHNWARAMVLDLSCKQT